MSSCWGNDCAYWGSAKAYDSKLTGLSSLARTNYGDNPYIQLQLSSSFTGTVTAVRLTGRADCCINDGQNLNVYLSSDTNFLQGTLCQAGVYMQNLAETVLVLCPVTPTAKYVTVMRNATKCVLALQEVEALYNGECCRRLPDS